MLKRGALLSDNVKRVIIYAREGAVRLWARPRADATPHIYFIAGSFAAWHPSLVHNDPRWSRARHQHLLAIYAALTVPFFKTAASRACVLFYVYVYTTCVGITVRDAMEDAMGTSKVSISNLLWNSHACEGLFIREFVARCSRLFNYRPRLFDQSDKHEISLFDKSRLAQWACLSYVFFLSYCVLCVGSIDSYWMNRIIRVYSYLYTNTLYRLY